MSGKEIETELRMSDSDDIESDIRYVIEVCHMGRTKYIRTTRMVVHFIDYARSFCDKSAAKKYFKKSEFADCEYRIIERFE